MALTIPRRWLIVSGPPRSDGICLTFDDGPHPEYTPRLLDRLGQLKVRATFFVVGRAAAQHPQLVRRIAAEGHALGHHSWTHGDPVVTSARVLVAEARRTAALLAAITGAAPRLFRPPHGKLTAIKAITLWTNRQSIVLWNRDPKDFLSPSADALRAWVARSPLAGGDVVLLHDVHPHAVDALDAFVSPARQRGLRFTTPLEWA